MLTGFVVGFALGDQHSLILKQDGSVWSTALTLHSRFPSDKVGTHFVQVSPSDATAVAAGTSFSMVLEGDDNVLATGLDYQDQLGDGPKQKDDTFYFVRVIVGAIAVAVGGYHSMILTRQGQVWAMGFNKYGQLGDGSAVPFSSKFLIAMASGAKAIATGDLHSGEARWWCVGRGSEL